MAAAVINAAIVAFLVVAAVVLFRLCRRPTESPRDRIVREAHERAEEAQRWDSIVIAWNAPAYEPPVVDPSWDAGRERLWDAARDQHTNTPEGD